MSEYYDPVVPPPAPAGYATGPTPQQRFALRVARRPEPRFGVALAGVGVGLTILGVLVLGSAQHIGGGEAGRHGAGIVLALAVALAGYVLVAARPVGPLATAGVAASALGVPVALGFAVSAGHADADTAVDVVLLASIAAWLLSYAFAPGARGHVFYLGASTLTFWAFLMYSVDDRALGTAVLFPFASLGSDNSGTDGTSDGIGVDGGLPNFSTLAVVSIIVGVVYYAVALTLDGRARSGAATGFVVGGFPAMVAGLGLAAVRSPLAAEGVLILVSGAALGAVGARGSRRFTTWFWTAGIGVGVVVILVDAIPNRDRTAGVLLIVIGVAVVALTPLASRVLREPDETAVTRGVPGG